MELCFSKISTKSTIRKDLLAFCEDSEPWINPEIGTFLQKRPSKDLIFQDTFLKYICENFLPEYGFDASVNIFMIKPWTHYMLHKDVFRASSINLMINDYTDSISYFQVSEIYNKMHMGIKELAYETDYYYLFNSKIPHAVTNRQHPRYLLSISLDNNYETMRLNLQNQLCL